MREIKETSEQIEKNEQNMEHQKEEKTYSLEQMEDDLSPSGEVKHDADTDLKNSKLFEENPPGEYEYYDNGKGKGARGQLALETGERNQYVQRTVGKEDRRDTDDGGHLIGARFKGSGEEENLEAQDRGLNRGGYKRMEGEWASDIKSGEKLYVDIETYKSNGSERPDAYMGYVVKENSDGKRSLETFSYQNEDMQTQDSWDETVNETDIEENDDVNN